MKFPLLNISEQKWKDDDFLLDYFLLDEFIYNDSKVVFQEYFKVHSFCDCFGEIYKVKCKVPPKEWWRRVFKFIPNVYKIELRFERTGNKMSVYELKTYLIDRIKDLSENEFTKNWIEQIKQAKNHEEIICIVYN